MTASVAERLDRLSCLTTDNFLRAQAELDWEEERASLVSVELDSLHLSLLHGPADGVASSCNPIAGFTQAPFGSGQRSGGSGDSERWNKAGRLYHAAGIVESINVDKWSPSGVGGVQPLYELSFMTNKDRIEKVADKTLDSSEASSVPNSARSQRGGQPNR